jgi:hypothetical protein
MADCVLRVVRAVAVLVSMAFVAPALAVDRLVPSQYPTIQAAVDAAVNGDVIRVAPGTYNERVTVDNKSIAIRGEMGKAAQTIISSSLDGPVLSIDGSVDPALLGLSDLTFRHIGGVGTSRSGIFYRGPLNLPIVIERCIIRDNRNNNDWAGGAYVMGRAEFRRCAFINNASGNFGAVAYVYDLCPVSFIECSFRDHTATSGGLFYARNSAITVTGSTIRSANLLASAGPSSGTVTFTNNRGCLITTVGGAGFVNGGGNNWNSCPDCDNDGLPDLEEIIFGAADCNGNLIPDSCDIASGTATDVNDDGIIDACQSPTIRHVPSQYATIQAAVNASISGDTVRIAPGIYNERVTVDNKSIAIRGEMGKAAQTIISSSLDGPVLSISGTNPSLMGVSDLTLTHSVGLGTSRRGFEYGGPITAPIVVERCIIRGNYSNSAFDDAAAAKLLGRAQFRRCAFIDNRSVNGGVILSYDNCPVEFIECSFRDHANSSGGLFRTYSNAPITVTNCTIRNANVLCSGSATVTFTNNRGCLITTVGGAGFVNGGGNNWNSCLDCDNDGLPDLEELISGAADCNGNTIPDSCDISAGTATDFNGNGVLDQCECPSDIVPDGIVDGADLGAVLSAWGSAGRGSVADIVRDGEVNSADLAVILTNWGPCK